MRFFRRSGRFVRIHENTQKTNKKIHISQERERSERVKVVKLISRAAWKSDRNFFQHEVWGAKAYAAAAVLRFDLFYARTDRFELTYVQF